MLELLSAELFRIIKLIVDEIVSEIISYKPEFVPKIYKIAFQIKPGGYGEGDEICGISIPTLRKIAKKFCQISLDDCEKLLQNKLHDARFVALVILNHKFKTEPVEVQDLYLKNMKYVNNWDLVDCSAPHILGKFCLMTGDPEKILKLSESENFWENRAAVVATLTLIKADNFMLTLDLCDKFINHEHHLIHKACGWMLREVSKKNPEVVIEFIKDHQNISSITKSYALEWLKKRKS